MNRLKKFWKYFIMFILVFFIVDFSVFCIIELPEKKEQDEVTRTIQTKEDLYFMTKYTIEKYFTRF
ncbi:MAG: hypothetical protein Q4G05_02195 [Clostridia bacterium]|nr:hypothetical protein [Clostridia bacterium]